MKTKTFVLNNVLMHQIATHPSKPYHTADLHATKIRFRRVWHVLHHQSIHSLYRYIYPTQISCSQLSRILWMNEYSLHCLPHNNQQHTVHIDVCIWSMNESDCLWLGVQPTSPSNVRLHSMFRRRFNVPSQITWL